MYSDKVLATSVFVRNYKSILHFKLKVYLYLYVQPSSLQSTPIQNTQLVHLSSATDGGGGQQVQFALDPQCKGALNSARLIQNLSVTFQLSFDSFFALLL